MALYEVTAETDVPSNGALEIYVGANSQRAEVCTAEGFGATPTLKLSLSKVVTVRQVPEGLLARFRREASRVRTIDGD